MVAYYHVLVNIAKSWQTELDPHIDDSRNYDDIGYIDFGGGIIPGEAGLLMRACTPADVDPSKPWGDVRVNGHAQRLVGPLKWNGKDWYCVGATSRDSYAGTIHGLSVALDFLADDRQQGSADDARERPHGDDGLRGEVPMVPAASARRDREPGLRQQRSRRTDQPAVHPGGPAPPASAADRAPRREGHRQRRGRAALRPAVGSKRWRARFCPGHAGHVHARRRDPAARSAVQVPAPPDVVLQRDPPRARPDASARLLKRALGIMDATTTDDGNAFYEAMPVRAHGRDAAAGRSRHATTGSGSTTTPSTRRRRGEASRRSCTPAAARSPRTRAPMRRSSSVRSSASRWIRCT